MAATRFFKCSSFDPGYLRLFYEAHPDLKDLNYTEHRSALMADCYGWADFWQKNLEATGKIICADVVVNAEVLQKKWALENSVKWKEDNWTLEILLAQIREFRPDILFTHDFASVTPVFRHLVRQEVPSIKMIIGWDGVARCDAAHFSGCDLILSCSKHVVDYYCSQGVRSVFFKMGFEASVLSRINLVERTTGCSFIGSIYLGSHERRLHRIAEIARQVPVDLHLAISRGRFIRSRAGLIARGHFGALWKIRQSWSDYKLISRISKPNLFGIEMYRKLAESRIGLNIHIDASGDRTGNMRLFEVTGMGACLLTDRKSNLADFFEEGKEVVAFNDAADAVAKLKWLLSAPDCCRKIAAAGQTRTIKDHSLANSISDFAKKYIYT